MSRDVAVMDWILPLDARRSGKMMKGLIRLAGACVLLSGASAHPCDDEHGALCPSSGADNLGRCLTGASYDDPSALSDGCQSWLAMNKACASDMKAKCPGAAYSNDAALCLTSWTRRDELSATCAATVPEPEEEEVRELDEAAQRKRDRRRAARKKAADEVRGKLDGSEDQIKVTQTSYNTRVDGSNAPPPPWYESPLVQLAGGCLAVAALGAALHSQGLLVGSFGKGGAGKSKKKFKPPPGKKGN